MSKHTTGEWKVVQHMGDWGFRYALTIEADGKKEPIAEIHSEGTVECFNNDQNNIKNHLAYANARLIASAPDLLEVLKFALNESGCDGDLCCHEWHDKARKVISKAEGKD
jgi:hypothetical protein